MEHGNCWLGRTPLETALLLVLVVSLPFLIILVVIYIILILNGCPNCSYKCSEFCEGYNISFPNVLPIFGFSESNTSVTKLMKKHEICPIDPSRDFKDKSNAPFIVAIIANVYQDDLHEQQYICCGVVITFKWILSSKCCVEIDYKVYGMFVRAASNYWAKDGSIHEIERIIFAEKGTFTLAAIELKQELPKISTIRPVMLARSSFFENSRYFDAWSWGTNWSLPLRFRKKYAQLKSEPIVVYDKGKEELWKSTYVSHPYETKHIKDGCVYYTGFCVTNDKILAGINVGAYCDESKNITVYLIFDVSNSIKWLENLTNVYVEYS